MSDLRKIIKEELSKTDINNMIDKKLDSAKVEALIKSVLDKHLKNNQNLEKEVMTITKNALTQLYKTLWTKRSFWQSGIKNKTS